MSHLATLILELERVAEMSTDGEYFSMAGDKNMFNICGGGAMIAMNVFHDNAAAIAIRHNTAAMVVVELKKLSHVLECQETDGLLDAFLHQVDMQNNERVRADQAEARLSTARSVITDLQIHMNPDPGKSATEAFDRAIEFLTEPTPPTKRDEETT